MVRLRRVRRHRNGFHPTRKPHAQDRPNQPRAAPRNRATTSAQARRRKRDERRGRHWPPPSAPRPRPTRRCPNCNPTSPLPGCAATMRADDCRMPKSALTAAEDAYDKGKQASRDAAAVVKEAKAQAEVGSGQSMDVELADGVTIVRIDHPPVNAFDLGAGRRRSRHRSAASKGRSSSRGRVSASRRASICARSSRAGANTPTASLTRCRRRSSPSSTTRRRWSPRSTGMPSQAAAYWRWPPTSG